MLTPLLLFGAFFTSVALVWAFTGRRSAYAERLEEVATATGPVVTLDGSGQAQQMRLPRKWEVFLARAGVDWTAGQALFVAGLYGVAGAAAGQLIHLPILGFACGVVALFLKLRIDQGRRTNKLAEQLPDALMLMATAIKSGLGFQQALQMVGEEGAAPISEEFRRFASDLALGLPIDEALVRLQGRMGSVDAEMLASALLVQRQTGGNLSEILINLHHTIRDRQNVIGQVRTLTAQGKMSGVVLTALPVVLAVAVYGMNPTYMGVLFVDPRGQMMLGVMAVLMIIGGFAIRKIATITL
ncbi:MAG: type II secretion system F family protein [Candidatus Sericytochromatia bacterium]